jgi:hypothetical protein
MSRKELWSDRPAERYDTKTREIWIDLDRSDDLVIGLRVDVAIDVAGRREGETWREGISSPLVKSAQPNDHEPEN